jgi:N utilization substance protein B
MLSRRLLRIKVMQSLYACSQLEQADMAGSEKELIRSISKLHDLFIYQLSFLADIFVFARKKIENGKLKLLPTDEDLHPNTKFIDNMLISKMLMNRDYQRQEDKLKISWKEEEEMLRRIYNSFCAGEEYRDYMAADGSSFGRDKDIVITLFKNYIAPDEILQSFYEEQNIYWANDYPVVNLFVLKCLKAIDEDWGENALLPDFSEEQGFEESLDFALELYRTTLCKGSEYEKMISSKTLNWDMERIAHIDMILLKMAVAEILEFSFIPVKVSFNEYIEIAKEYSTPKSKIFINGVLDKLIAELRDKNMINKKGRGLME